MTTIFSDVTKVIGTTPMIQLRHITEGVNAPVFAKLEFQNPLGSVKDRIGIAMIEAAETKGLIDPNTTIVEPTS